MFLDAFEGPLDLLLYVIRKQNFNILDIPMAAVTRQYLAYIEQIRSRNLELAAEYLVMAALLIEIKSRILLPPKRTASDEEPDDPRAELARRLLEYEQIKLAAARLDALPQLGRDFLAAQIHVEQTLAVRLPDVTPVDLQNAWAALLRRAQILQRHTIARAALSVREHMGMILKTLRQRPVSIFEDLFDVAHGVQGLVVTLMALLELSREKLVQVVQAEAYAPIYVHLGANARS